MSLRNKVLADIINDCEYYEDEFERPRYINNWRVIPAFAYNNDKKCRDLEALRLTYHPIVRTTLDNNIFNYRTNNPRRKNGITKYEAFSKNYNNLEDILLMVSILTVIYICLK